MTSSPSQTIGSRIEHRKWYHYMIIAVVVGIVCVLIGDLLLGDGRTYHDVYEVFYVLLGIVFVLSFYLNYPLVNYNESEITLYFRFYSIFGSPVITEPLSHLVSVTRVSPSCLSIELKRTESELVESRTINGNERDITQFLKWIEAKTNITKRPVEYQLDPHLELSKLAVYLLLLFGVLFGIIIAIIIFLA